MARVVDLRSDTVTLPTPAMREAMARAPLGDDCYGEDPTVNRLQDVAAERLGTEAALLVSSGTMGNLVGLLAHCALGDEVVAGDGSHVVLGEGSGLSIIGGIQLRSVPDQRGLPSLADVEGAMRASGSTPRTAAVALENTHNRAGGVGLDAAATRAVAELAHRYGAALHLDGARLFNAAVALGVDARELAAPADSVTFCLSKGLAAPVGSVLCGGHAYIARAHHWRKVLGGAMRQAGVIAAAGIVALETMVDRLAEDHATARRLAEGLAELPGIEVDLDTVQTNIVYLDVRHRRLDARAFAAHLAAAGALFHPMDETRARMVTHYGIAAGDVDFALAAAGRALRAA